MAKKWVNVKRSKPHRRPAHNISGYKMSCSKPFRIDPYKRRPRRTDAQIKASKKRKKKGGK